jgi:hypothetical protein
MKNKTHFWLLALMVCVLIAGQALAAETPKVSTGQTGMASLLGPQRSSQIVGMSVKNSKGQNLGKIDELIIGQDGAVKYAILSHGGLLGIGDKLVPIPWRALKPGTEDKTLMVNIDKAALEKAPSFEAKEWPSFAEPEWQRKVEVYYELPQGQATR